MAPALVARLAEVLVPHSAYLDVLANPIDRIQLSVLRLAAPDPLSDKGPRLGRPPPDLKLREGPVREGVVPQGEAGLLPAEYLLKRGLRRLPLPNILSDCARISSSAAERSSVLRSPSVQATTSACRSSAAAAVQRAKAEGNDGGKLARESSASAVWPVSLKQCERARNTDSSLNSTETSIRSATSIRVTTLRR